LTALALLTQHIRVTGVVQGVGFRPFVYRLASDLNLPGWMAYAIVGILLLMLVDRTLFGIFNKENNH